jgi:hypothetical protein
MIQLICDYCGKFVSRQNTIDLLYLDVQYSFCTLDCLLEFIKNEVEKERA